MTRKPRAVRDAERRVIEAALRWHRIWLRDHEGMPTLRNGWNAADIALWNRAQELTERKGKAR